MTFHEAARAQYLRNSYYTVWLVVPDGARRQLGATQRKTGTGLMAVLRRDSVQAIVRSLPGAESATFTKRAGRLEFSNGYRVEFGGTIRQEAAEGGAA